MKQGIYSFVTNTPAKEVKAHSKTIQKSNAQNPKSGSGVCLQRRHLGLRFQQGPNKSLFL
jgi:hypothetical protein